MSNSEDSTPEATAEGEAVADEEESAAEEAESAADEAEPPTEEAESTANEAEPATDSDATTSEDADGSSTPGAGEVYCRDCGAVISEKAEICPECGVRQQSPDSSLDDVIEVLTNGENPFVAAVYSAILPGLGQFYNREPGKGAAIIVASFLSVLSMAVLIGFVLYPAIWLYAVYDAYVVADGREPPLGS
jgi:TM2 domain-containing membrane protein YozV